MHELAPPFPSARWEGRACSFDHGGVRLVGICERATWAGYTVRGAIPDWRLLIRGASGRTVEVSLVEQHVTFN